MDLSLEWLPLLVVFLLPGFIAFYTGQYLNPAREIKLSSFELGLISLGYSLIISCVEGLLFVAILPLLGTDIGKLIRDPIQDTLATYPGQAVLGMTAWVTIGLIAGLFIGLHDPVFNRSLRGKLDRLGINKADIWFSVFDTRKYENIQVLVHMKNGDVYAGYLGEYDLTPDDNGNREFVIMGVHFRPGPETILRPHDKGVAFGRNSAVFLNTRDVNAIDILFQPKNA